eukprot:CAMPEP_0182428978 /NCGR_PEP_ID=MMETSP1167-20130531/25198_1 /TAXON_ID=2988 /ORGANISM="Mallomonas Sp, Strain CCMP3275" /LENGTH=541 /DNA_ID=CAMNT_0024612247 /DNA_START=192 /DNA_END=1817 /DNA_ORIENTATION=-
MSKALKLRGKLDSYAKERQSFENKRRELEEEMAKGKQNMGKIRKGLRNNEIKMETPLQVDIDVEFGRTDTEGRRLASRALKRGGNKNALDSPVISSPNIGSTKMAVTIPSTALLSEWAFTGSIDSTPPVLKSQDLYEFVRLIGRGAFGTVDLVKNTDDDRLYATKTVLISESESAEVEAGALQEVKHLRINRHPGIIDVMEVFIMAQPRVLNIVMTFCEAGDLAKTIQHAQKNHNLLSEAQILKWISQLFMAMSFLQENHTLHRDIKPSNILLTDNGEICKIADFGLATEVKDGRCKSLAEAGTPYYTSPEMVNNEPYSFPSDNWSLGVVLHELMRLQLPFHGASTAELVRLIVTEPPPPLPAHYSEELRGISAALLRKDPNERLTMGTALKTPLMSQKVTAFVHGYRPKMVEERQRRAHTRQLVAQLERINSEPWPPGIPQVGTEINELRPVVAEKVQENEATRAESIELSAKTAEGQTQAQAQAQAQATEEIPTVTLSDIAESKSSSSLPTIPNLPVQTPAVPISPRTRVKESGPLPPL